MKLSERIKESAEQPHFYFDVHEKVFTKEINSDAIPLAVLGEFAEDSYIRGIYALLEIKSLYGFFDSCSNFEELSRMEI